MRTLAWLSVVAPWEQQSADADGQMESPARTDRPRVESSCPHRYHMCTRCSDRARGLDMQQDPSTARWDSASEPAWHHPGAGEVPGPCSSPCPNHSHSILLLSGGRHNAARRPDKHFTTQRTNNNRGQAGQPAMKVTPRTPFTLKGSGDEPEEALSHS